MHKGWYRLWVVLAGLYIVPCAFLAVNDWPTWTALDKPDPPERTWTPEGAIHTEVYRAVSVYRDTMGLFVEQEPGNPLIRDPELVAAIKLSFLAQFVAEGDGTRQELADSCDSETARLMREYGSIIPDLALIRDAAAVRADTMNPDSHDVTRDYIWEERLADYDVARGKARTEYVVAAAKTILRYALLWVLPPVLLLAAWCMAVGAFKWVRDGFRAER